MYYYLFNNLLNFVVRLDCTSLTSVVLPTSLSSFGAGTFACKIIMSFYFFLINKFTFCWTIFEDENIYVVCMHCMYVCDSMYIACNMYVMYIVCVYNWMKSNVGMQNVKIPVILLISLLYVYVCMYVCMCICVWHRWLQHKFGDDPHNSLCHRKLFLLR